MSKWIALFSSFFIFFAGLGFICGKSRSPDLKHPDAPRIYATKHIKPRYSNSLFDPLELTLEFRTFYFLYRNGDETPIRVYKDISDYSMPKKDISDDLIKFLGIGSPIGLGVLATLEKGIKVANTKEKFLIGAAIISGFGTGFYLGYKKDNQPTEEFLTSIENDTDMWKTEYNKYLKRNIFLLLRKR